MEERRKFPRIKDIKKIKYKIINKPLRSSSATVDISPAGVRFPVSQKLELGLGLELVFQFNEVSVPLTVQGEVVWRNENNDPRLRYEVGVSFVNLSPESSKLLENYLEERENEGAA